MKKIALITFLFIWFQFSFSQQYSQIPETHRMHPELGKTSYQSTSQNVDYELIHLRSKYSKTFLNTNKTKTTIQSSSPLHHQDNKGFWLTTDNQITNSGNQLIFPSHNPTVQFDKNTQVLSIYNSTNDIKFRKEVQFSFVDNTGRAIQKLENKNSPPSITSASVLHFNDYLQHIDKKYTFYQQAVKSDYIIKNKAVLPLEFEQLVIEEIIDLPSGFSIKQELNTQQKANRLLIFDNTNQLVFTFHQPIVSDAKPIEKKFKHAFKPEEAFYEIIQLADNSFKIQTIISGDYLSATERVFPITIDPVISIENTNTINSCFFPNYQQSTLIVPVPSGETVLFSDISYDFVATSASQAWVSEQRSFVSGPNGQTGVFEGAGNESGNYTYTINNSDVGNVVSSGLISYVFNFSRTWGGWSCNATFNFVNRREISVTYGTIEFGSGPIFINEYSASNRSFVDGFNRTEDWIELYNASPDTFFNLQGYHLSNNADNPTMWQIQNGLIPPNSRVLVFCTKRDVSSGTVFYSNFNLTQLRPDQIILADPNGVILESHEMFVTQTNHSYGRSSDGAASWQVFSTPTPRTSNSSGFAGYTTKPTFTVEPGRYQNTVTFSLTSSGENEQIRYTTNGSTPNASSILFTTPITRTATSVIRARSFSTNPAILPGFIETNTYFINENTSLPSFSFVGDQNLVALFNGDIDLKPLAHFEYFESDGSFVDENLGDFDKHGNDSWTYPQRGADFVSRDDHGYKRRLEHQFFETTERTRFSRLMVKAGASDNYPFETGGAHIRDPFIQTLSQVVGLDLDERSSSYVSLFVNGTYWGVYDLREKVDDNDYTDHYYGQDQTFSGSDVNLQYIKTWGSTRPEYGNAPSIADWNSLTQYVQNNNMGESSHFNFVDSQLNIDSLIDYIVINSFVVSRDWLNYNTGWWRGLDPNGEAQKWRYTLWDMDAALGHYTNFTGMPNVTATASPCQVENLSAGAGHTQTLKKLIEENPAIRQKYITRYADLLNTQLSCDNITTLFDSMVAEIAPEMPRQIQRWGGNMPTWQNNVQVARTFLTTRCNYLMNAGLASCYNLTGPFSTTFTVLPANSGKIKMNSEWLATFPFQAQVFGTIETILKAEANAGFIFSHWNVDGAIIQPNDLNPEIILQLSQATQVTANFIDPTQNGDDLIYYWHFNTLETPADVTAIVADFKLIQTATPVMTYTGSGPRDIDANNQGSSLNLHLGEESGKNARVRNPSIDRSLVFDLSTIGFNEIKFGYAVARTNSGQLQNIIEYSVDGTTFIQTGLTATAFDITTDFNLIQLDFTSIEEVSNNPNFKIRITFEGNNVALNGNNRFDNITLKGRPIPLGIAEKTFTKLQLFPNPARSEINLLSTSAIMNVTIYNLLGQYVTSYDANNATEIKIPISNFSDGLYLMKVHGIDFIETLKFMIKK
jgi:hypothetical protein